MAPPQHALEASIPFEWLRSPNDTDRRSLLEFTRGAIYSLSRKEDGRFDPVHVSRIQRAFRPLGEPSLYKVGLRLLQLLREAEPLFGGYWILAPFRTLKLQQGNVFIGAVPNAHSLLGPTNTEGLARFITDDVAATIPTQKLEMWMGRSRATSRRIVEDFVAYHEAHSARSSQLTGVQFLHVGSGSNGMATLRWTNVPFEVVPASKIALCRQLTYGYYRHFSASVRNGEVFSEAPILGGLSALRLALTQHLGKPLRAFVHTGSESATITVPERLPIEEFRLGLLLARRIDRFGIASTFELTPGLAQLFTTKLIQIGLLLEEQK